MNKIVNLYGYSVLEPPFSLNYYDWTKEQAKEYKDWFIKNMYERAEYVMEVSCTSSLLNDTIHCTDISSPNNLITVWKWFRKVVRYEPRPQQEIEAWRTRFGDIGVSTISKVQLTVLSEFIVRDIGMLMSVILTENYSHLYWDIIKRPKNHIYINRPVIKGFIDDNPKYPKPFAASFEPVHMVGVQASKILRGKSTDTDLFDIYKLWVSWIPKTPDMHN